MSKKDLRRTSHKIRGTKTATWATTKPTKPGWYWYRGESDMNEIVLWVSSDLRVIFPASLNFKSFPVDSIGGEWSSEPLEPPTGSHGTP